MKIAAGHLLSLALLALPMMVSAASSPSIPVVLGHSTAALNSPWKFHTGDDPRWADPAFDDSSWESMDLSAPPDANDGDVGITPYTSGWNSKGHAGYQGYAWYRIRFTVTPPPGGTLALLGPWAVDSAYQVYGNGALLGGVGDFSGTTPAAYSYHYPTYFELPTGLAGGGDLVIAIRVWAGPWVGGADGGGIHVAPVIGAREAIAAQHRLQWLTIFEGYAVDVVPAMLFLLMAVLSLCLPVFGRGDHTRFWLAIALTLSGIQRGNQAFFFWWQIETVQGFVILIDTLAASLSLGAWMMAWRGWYKVARPAWQPKAVAALTLVLMLVLSLGQPWLFHVTYPHPMAMVVHYLMMGVRLAFLAVFALLAYQGIRRHSRESWYALPAMIAIGMVLFSQELSLIHVPGIWFPYGIGVSLSEIMSVAFDLLLFILLARRLWSNPTRQSETQLESRA